MQYREISYKQIKYFIWWYGFIPYLRCMILQTTTHPLASLPDLSRPLRIMDLCFKVEQKLIYSDNLIADSVRLAMHNGTPYSCIVSMLKDMAVDNRGKIEDMIGTSLTQKLFTI